MTRIFSKKHAKLLRFIPRFSGAILFNILIVVVFIVVDNPSLFSLAFPIVLWFCLVYFIRYVAAILLVALLVFYLVRTHKGSSEVQYNTYIDSALFAKFNVLALDVTPEDRMYWQSQRNIERKMREEGNNYQVSTSGAAVYTDADEPKSEIPLPTQGSEEDLNPEKNPELPIASFKNSRPAGGADPLSDIPEFDPDGPDPFK